MVRQSLGLSFPLCGLSFFFLICSICRSNLPLFLVSFRGNCSTCSCRFGVSVGGDQFRMHLCHHFQLELVEFLVPTDTVLMICDLTARLLSSSLPPIPFLIISKQTSNVYLITWKNFDTGVKTKFFANLFHSVKHSFKCLCEEGFYRTVTIVDYIKKKKYLDF